MERIIQGSHPATTKKPFKLLIEKLIQGKIRFRWEIPRGVSFLYENKKMIVKSTEQMHEFLLEKMKGLDKTDEHKRKQNGT